MAQVASGAVHDGERAKRAQASLSAVVVCVDSMVLIDCSDHRTVVVLDGSNAKV